MIHVNVRERDAAAQATEPITSGSVGLAVSFRFSEDWDGLAKAALFKGSGTAVDVALTGSGCTVPHEVLASAGGHLKIGVYGTGSQGQRVTPTVWADAGQIFEGAEPSEIEPTPATESLVQQVLEAAETAVEAAESAESIAQGIRDDADSGEFDGEDGASAYELAVEHGYTGTEAQWLQSLQGEDGASAYELAVENGYTGTEAQWLESLEGDDGASAYEIAVEHGYTGTEEQWLESLHGQDATVDATLSNEGEAADAKATGAGISAAQHKGDYALKFAETMNNGVGIPLDAEWLSGDIGGSRTYRVHSKRAVNTEQKVLQAAAGYRFYLRIYSSGSYSDSNWYGPDYSSRKTYTLPKGADYILVVSTYPEDQSVTADPETYGSQVTIKNNIGSGGGSITVDDALSGSSENPVQNKVLKAALDEKADASNVPTKTSDLQNDSGFLTQHQSLAAYRTAAAQDTIDAGKADKVTEVTNTSTGDVTLQLDPGKIYHFTGAISSLTLTLATPASGQLAQYHFDFDSGSTAATISISGVTWPGGSFAPEASTHYEVDILNGYGVVCEW